MIVVDCKNVEQTKALGLAIGKALKGGEVLEFSSDLGGGKTTFVKGLAAGMGVAGVIQSPTFTISFIHQAGDLELHHFDFYRLQDAGIMSAELAESLEQPNAVVAIEWGDIVHNILPADLISVTISVAADSESRQIKFEVPQKFNYISKVIEDFKNDSDN